MSTAIIVHHLLTLDYSKQGCDATVEMEIRAGCVPSGMRNRNQRAGLVRMPYFSRFSRISLALVASNTRVMRLRMPTQQIKAHCLHRASSVGVYLLPYNLGRLLNVDSTEH